MKNWSQARRRIRLCGAVELRRAGSELKRDIACEAHTRYSVGQTHPPVPIVVDLAHGAAHAMTPLRCSTFSQVFHLSIMFNLSHGAAHAMTPLRCSTFSEVFHLSRLYVLGIKT